MRPKSTIVWLLTAVACGTAQPAARPAERSPSAPPAPPTAPPPASTVPATPVEAPARRALRASERFVDLVAATQALAASGAADSTTGCLVARDGDGFRLEADLLPAVRPLPEPPADLAAGLAKGRVRVLSHWGQTGQGDYELALVGITTTPASAARAPATALLLTRQGVFLRHGERDADADDGPLALDALGARLVALPDRVLYVTAERDVAIGDLHALLARLPFDRPVALAVALAPGTRIPEEPLPAKTSEWLCQRGLPRLPRGTRTGELGTAAIATTLAPLREQGARCLAAATGPALAGGKLTLALRVDERGRVAHVCALASELADPALARCVIESARMLTFPVPSPAGSVDLHLPLELAPIGFALQRPVCF